MGLPIESCQNKRDIGHLATSKKLTMKSTISILSFALLFASACGKDDKPSEPDTKVVESEPKTPSAVGKSASLDGLFVGTTVTLPDEMTKVVFGKSEADNQKVLGQESNYRSSEAFKDVSFQMRSSDEHTKSIDVSVEDGLEAAVTKAWGTPAKDKKGLAYWYNPEAGLRAYVSPYGKGKTLVIDRYQPLGEFLGATGFELAFAKDKPLLGASIEELHAAWGDALCNYEEQGPPLIASYAENRENSIGTFPPSYNYYIDLCWDLNRGAGTNTKRDKLDVGANGRVARYRMTVPTQGSPELAASTIAFLNKKLGEPVVTESEHGQEHHYASAEDGLKVKALVTKGNEDVHVVITEFLPLEQLLGGDGPGLGVAPESVFGTFEDIAKDDPDHFEPSGVLASLVYPGTEFSSHLTKVKLSKMAKAKKVTSYSVVLHYKGYPDLEAKILSLLETKFGPARESKRKASKGKFLDFGGKGQHKVEVWQVNEQFQITFSK
tara:strand:- start:100942 stop:102420 length:1479 start_codon:yes stop_codon:yes gene_type:complete